MHELMQRNAARASMNVTFKRTVHSADPESCVSYKRLQGGRMAGIRLS